MNSLYSAFSTKKHDGMVKTRAQLAENQTATIEKFSHDGRGIARILGKTVFIEGALPEEKVVFKYTRVKSDYDEGQVVSVLTPSMHRVAPKCQHYAECGGCSLQHLDAQNQIHVKQSLLLELLGRIGHIQPESLLPPLTASSWHYRNKARLSVRVLPKDVLIGFRKKHKPRHLVGLNHCPILHARVSEALPELKKLIASLEKKEAIIQIEIAIGDEEIGLIFRNMEQLTAQDHNKLCTFGSKMGFILFLQPGNTQSVTKIYPETAGDFLHYALAEQGVRFAFHPTDFTQVNPEMNRKMVLKAEELLQLNAEDRVLDLFCGLGNFSLSFAKKCDRVIGVEGSEAMVQRASQNAIANQLSNTQFFCADLSKEHALDPFLNQNITKILLDPPRTGAVEIIRQSNKLKSRCIVYVSCNPATFARDAGILVQQQGYRLKTVGVMDMFPHTAHVESIALFEKG